MPDPNDGDARRTSLSLERTQLAWWRTGLAALAVGIGVGRLIPALQDQDGSWQYVALGVGYAVYGVALISFGTLREQVYSIELARSRYELVLAAAGIALGVATALLILFG
jgi:uncharacterized membrane protein YidH (DUF202 family)